MTDMTAEIINKLKQAQEELDELRAAIEYDEEFMADAYGFLKPLEQGVAETLAAIEAGTHQFSDEDLPFMEYVTGANKTLLPFKFLFTQINDLHKELSTTSGT